jgi:hypothetical protein
MGFSVRCVFHACHAASKSESFSVHLQQETPDLLFRVYAERGVVDGWGLLHSLLADVVDAIVGAANSEASSAAAAERDAWTLIASLSTEMAKDNCMGLLDLMDELTAGTVIMPRGLPLMPTADALAWAEGDAELVPLEAWPVLGVPGASAETSLPVDAYMTAETWRLHSGAWQLIYMLQKTVDGFLAPGGSASWQQSGVSIRRVSTSGADFAIASPRGAAGAGVPSASNAGASKAVAEEAVRSGAADRVPRLILRMVLIALRCAAPSVASDCVASACRLLPSILDSSMPGRMAKAMSSETHGFADRNRMHLLLACLVKLNARLRTGRPGPLGQARQLALAKAAHDICEVTRNALPSDSASFPSLPGAHDSQFWEKARQGVSWAAAATAARDEILFLRHMAAAHDAAMQLLENEAEARHLVERTRRTAFVTSAREALGAICAADKSRRAAARVAHEEESQSLWRTWRNLQRSLVGECGLWMDPDAVEPQHWKLDKFEDPSRRRVKLKRNYKFQMYHEPAKGPPLRPSHGSEAALHAPLALPGVRMRGPHEDEDEPEEGMGSPQNSLPMPTASSLGAPPEVDDAATEALLDSEREADNAVGLQEEVLFSTSCQLVTPKHVVPGTLRLTNLYLHFIGDPPTEEAQAASPPSLKPARTHKRWLTNTINELHHARFLLQQSALELFLADRSNALLNFSGSQVRCIHSIFDNVDCVLECCSEGASSCAVHAPASRSLDHVGSRRICRVPQAA